MIRLLTRLFILLLFLISCEKEDNKPPKVDIINPQSNIVVYERDTVFIELSARDNDRIAEVKLFLDDEMVFSTQNPPFSYHLVTTGRLGHYILKAEATDPAGNRGESNTLLISVLPNTRPVASFSFSPEAGLINESIIFDASNSTDEEDELADLQFRWDWESDGQWDSDYLNTPETSHTYTEPGRYQVSLQVKDSQNNTDATSAEITIQGKFVDPRDEKSYRTIFIGGNFWFAENLNYEMPGNSWCYSYSEENCDIYGRLYTWGAAVNACPPGWRLSTDDDWLKVEAELGMDPYELEYEQDRETGAVGRKLKSTEKWLSGSGIDSHGFTALPAGACSHEKYGLEFRGLGVGCDFWITMYRDKWRTFHRGLSSDSDGIDRHSKSQGSGGSVRCVKGEAYPVIQTDEVRGVFEDQATVLVFLHSSGGDPEGSQVGLCWGTNERPTVEGNHTEAIQANNKEIFLTMPGLVQGTTYHIRAYAINRTGIAYGNDLTLPLPDILPVVITEDATDIGSNSVILRGEVIYDGPQQIVKGMVISKEPYSRPPGGKCENDFDPGVLYCNPTDLEPNTTYYYFAWAKMDDIFYDGEEKIFATSGIRPD